MRKEFVIEAATSHIEHMALNRLQLAVDTAEMVRNERPPDLTLENLTDVVDEVNNWLDFTGQGYKYAIRNTGNGWGLAIIDPEDYE